jgi:hypothetical protein
MSITKAQYRLAPLKSALWYGDNKMGVSNIPNRLAGLLFLGCLSPTATALTFQAIADFDAAVETKDGDLQKAELVLTPRMDFDLSESVRATLIARGRFDAVDELSPGHPAQHHRGQWNRRTYLGDNGDLELREAYIDGFAGDVFVRLGKQQVVWGQADGLRVLDVLNPIDYREFILSDLDERRIPLWMLNAEAPLWEGTLQLVAIPDKTYDELPPFNGAFGFSSRLLVPKAPAGVPVTMRDPDQPDRPLQDADAGVRWQAFLGGWDVSLNYLYHYHDQAVYYLNEGTGGIVVSPIYKRTHLTGATFSNAFGDFALRGEIGYSSDRYWVADPRSVTDGVVESPELAYVVGLDYSGISNTFFSVQAFQSYLTDHPTGVIRDTLETQLTLRIRHLIWNQALALEAFFIQSANDADGLLQLEANYQFKSDLVGRIGADLFFGNKSGLFGQFKEANRIKVGLAYSF